MFRFIMIIGMLVWPAAVGFGDVHGLREVAQWRPGARVEAVPGRVGHRAAIDGDEATFWQPHSSRGELTRYFEVPIDLARFEMHAKGLRQVTVAVARDGRFQFEPVIDRAAVEAAPFARELDASNVRAVRFVFDGAGWPRIGELRLFSSTTDGQAAARRDALRRDAPFVAVVEEPSHWRAKPDRIAVAETLDALRWPWAVFGPDDVAAVAERIDDFDLLLLNTMHRLPADAEQLQPIVAAINAFLKRGGVAVCFDMDRDEQVRWIRQFGPTFRLRAGRGAVGELTGLPVHFDDPAAGLLTRPHAIAPFETPAAHLLLHSEGWQVLASDGEGYAVLVQQALGDGQLVVCSGQLGRLPIRSLLVNLWAAAGARRTGLVVEQLRWP